MTEPNKISSDKMSERRLATMARGFKTSPGDSEDSIVGAVATVFVQQHITGLLLGEASFEGDEQQRFADRSWQQLGAAGAFVGFEIEAEWLQQFVAPKRQQTDGGDKSIVPAMRMRNRLAAATMLLFYPSTDCPTRQIGENRLAAR
jgi:hypothetical protein